MFTAQVEIKRDKEGFYWEGIVRGEDRVLVWAKVKGLLYHQQREGAFKDAKQVLGNLKVEVQ